METTGDEQYESACDCTALRWRDPEPRRDEGVSLVRGLFYALLLASPFWAAVAAIFY